MATFWERAILSVYLCFLNILYLFVILIASYFGFEVRTLVLIAQVPGQCLPLIFKSRLEAYLLRISRY